MTRKNNSSGHATNQLSPAKPILIGAVIALIFISMFLFSVDHPKPEWGKLWMLKPLIIVPLAGAIGGLFLLLHELSELDAGFQQDNSNCVELYRLHNRAVVGFCFRIERHIVELNLYLSEFK